MFFQYREVLSFRQFLLIFDIMSALGLHSSALLLLTLHLIKMISSGLCNGCLFKKAHSRRATAKHKGMPGSMSFLYWALSRLTNSSLSAHQSPTIYLQIKRFSGTASDWWKPTYTVCGPKILRCRTSGEIDLFNNKIRFRVEKE